MLHDGAWRRPSQQHPNPSSPIAGMASRWGWGVGWGAQPAAEPEDETSSEGSFASANSSESNLQAGQPGLAARARWAAAGRKVRTMRAFKSCGALAAAERAVLRVHELSAVASAEEDAAQEAELEAVKSEIAIEIASEELRAIRQYEAEEDVELARVPTAAMRTIWGQAEMEVASLGVTGRVMDRAQGKAVHRLMHEYVASAATAATCNVCLTATAPPDPGICCLAGHFSCRDCFVMSIHAGNACGPGGRADVLTTDPVTGAVTKPKGAFRCLGDPQEDMRVLPCAHVLPELEVMRYCLNHDEAAYKAYITMVGRHASEVALDDMHRAAEAEERRRADMAAASEGVIHHALMLGGGVRCPCGTLGIKDDECMHSELFANARWSSLPCYVFYGADRGVYVR